MVDLDKVVFNCKSIPYDLGNKFFTVSSFTKPLKYKTVNVEVAKSYKNRLSFFRFCNIKHIKEIENSIEILKKWNSQGFEIHFVSSRPYLKSFQKITVDWLLNNYIAFNSLVFSCTNKYKFCLKNNFNVIVDDTLVNCLYTSFMNIDAIWLTSQKHKMIDTPLNKKLHIATSWKEIDAIIQQLNQKTLTYNSPVNF